MKARHLALILPFFIVTVRAADPAPIPMPVPAPAPQTPGLVKPGIVGSSWVAEDLEKKGVIDDAKTFIRFDSAEKVSGSGGVNRFSGTCKLAGDKLSFGPLMSTRMAGPPAVMDQEAKFLAALAKVTAFQLDEKDLLHLLDKDGQELVRFSRSKGDPQDAVPVPKAPESVPDGH